ncbi:hypothetical protein ACXVUM_02855 [Williamsia sp. SKLECPSW1]
MSSQFVDLVDPAPSGTVHLRPRTDRISGPEKFVSGARPTEPIAI